MPGEPRGTRRPTFAERRERRAAADDPDEILRFAARFLETRPRSVAEVRRRLATAGYRPELVETAVGRLLELGYLDDRAFARGWVESRDRAHPRGEPALRRELALKGIDRPIVDEVLADRRSAVADVNGDADAEAAVRLLQRNAAALARIADPRARRNRAYALLARHGFDPSVASDAARRLVAGDTD